MSHLLHTDTCASMIRDVPAVRNHSALHPAGLFVSAVSLTGLEIWLLRPKTPLRHRTEYFNFQQRVAILDVTEPIAHRAAMIDSAVRMQGQRLGLADLLIAATALEQRLTLVTHSTGRFASVPGLTVLDWAVP
ncbi:MAG TPA: type II toxin-antitoxin system VapC family toxin [Gemmataceae bacterium]|jgi:tRNA(fMet)-specific endonuclease VapC|nr:type II toxin-antitoxin system VapC family toxin [Gemmataceae bacterium]